MANNVASFRAGLASWRFAHNYAALDRRATPLPLRAACARTTTSLPWKNCGAGDAAGGEAGGRYYNRHRMGLIYTRAAASGGARAGGGGMLAATGVAAVKRKDARRHCRQQRKRRISTHTYRTRGGTAHTIRAAPSRHLSLSLSALSWCSRGVAFLLAWSEERISMYGWQAHQDWHIGMAKTRKPRKNVMKADARRSAKMAAQADVGREDRYHDGAGQNQRRKRHHCASLTREINSARGMVRYELRARLSIAPPQYLISRINRAWHAGSWWRWR